MMTDHPIHLPLKKVNDGINGHIVTVVVDQSFLDNYYGMLQWVKGYNAGTTQNKFEYEHELIMFYRHLNSQIRELKKENK